MIYLNNAATSYPKPKEVTDAVHNYLTKFPSHGGRSSVDKDSGDVVYECRKNLSELFNADEPNQIVFTSGCTESLNLIIKGLDLKNAHIVTTATEHNSVIRPLKHLERDEGLKVDFVECDNFGYIEPTIIEEAIKQNTKAIIVNHTSNVNGSVLDIKSISEIAHKHNLLIIVDASQSAGNLPIDVKDMNIDLMAFTGHKSLYGMQGTGGFYIKKGIKVNPLKTGGTGTKSDELYQPETMPMYYESGTQNLPGIVSMKAGTDFILKKGRENISKHKRQIVKKVIDELSKFQEIKIYTRKEKNSCAVFSFNIDGILPEEVGFILENSYDITVRTGIHCAPLMLKHIDAHPWGTVRMSPSYFTTDNEIDKFLEAVKSIVKVFSKKI